MPLLALTAVLVGANFTCSGKGTVPGQGQYAVPAGAIVVSPTGNDSSSGTDAAPLRTLGGAVARAGSGATIVLHSGIYHESVVIPPDKRLTVQAWPKEAVWMDGSVVVAGWVASGGKWRKDGWTAEFDASPTYTQGAPDNVAAYWGFVNPGYPMAAHPDQIWIDGVAQRQVGSLAQVVPGTFFHDQAANQLWLGSDPTGKGVRASDLSRALMVRSAGSVLRGIGVRRYAPSVPDMGAVTIEVPRVLVEHVSITDNATTGLHVGSSTTTNDVVLRNLYVARNGMIGITATYADNLVVDRVITEGNNTEHFNQSPVAGGAKISRTRGVTVRDSLFVANDGPGLWMDESSYDMKITGNEMRNNVGHGTSLEISAKAVFANNFVTNNGGFGIKINDTSNVAMWNNTFVGNDRSINLVQDDRRPTSASSAGRDKRQPFPDPTMTWLNGPATFANNILANQRSGKCMLCVEDYSGQRSAAQIGVSANANLYNRPNTTTPALLVVWSAGSASPATYTTLTAFHAATGQEGAGQLVNGSQIVDANGSSAPVMATVVANTALPLPADIAALVGRPAGLRAHGASPR
ncbi:MAG: right-handed parallel beta-helix repeat-containing protein [Acidimicrobiia bacterium]